MRPATLASLVMLAALGLAGRGEAGCGCDKPPPPFAAIRPFVGYVDARITLLDARLVPGERYRVQFVARTDGSTDWSQGRAILARDLADGAHRPQLRVPVAPVSLGPAAVRVYDDAGVLLWELADDQFTVTAPPVPLNDFPETVVRDGYRTGVGADGTLYVPVHVGRALEATTFTGAANGYPLGFQAEDVVMYNMEGFLMQLLDPAVPGLFRITAGQPLSEAAAFPADVPAQFGAALMAPSLAPALGSVTSHALGYRRHEFRTYKARHRQLDVLQPEDDPFWHADGTYHVDHDTIVVAVRGTLEDGSTPAPGATPPFRLVITSSPTPLP